MESPQVVALHTDDGALAPDYGSSVGLPGFVDELEGVDEGVLLHLRRDRLAPRRHMKTGSN